VQTLRVWHGEAFAAGPPDTPAATVAALLVSRHLERATGPWETSVQLWTLPGRSVLTVLGAAYPRNAEPMRETVASSLNATADELDDATVRHAAAQVRREILFAARSPSGLVATVGRAYEAGGGPSDVESRLERLATLDAASIRSFLQQLIALGPVRSEVRP
jgi:predicted Zn-dependent peptidase